MALVLIPQGMAYAELAGLPPHVGLYAGALPLVVAALFASSPYLQTGPVAVTSLLTLGALLPLAPARTPEFVGLAALLALVVGVMRLAAGLLRVGDLAYLLSQPVIMGFTTAASLLIVFSQLPGVVGLEPGDRSVIEAAVWAATTPDAWLPAAVVMALGTATVVIAGRFVHGLVPWVLVASLAGILWTVFVGYDGPLVGDVPASLPVVSLDLPWRRLPRLLVPGGVIALIGFAEPAAIARLYAVRERSRWDPDREFVAQGAANFVSGLTGGYPVGGSFARSSLNHLLGATSRWSGAVTGLVVILFLPFAELVAPLPKAVLAGIVIAAVSNLIRIRPLLSMWKLSKPQTLVAWITFLLTLLLAPHVEQAILAGIFLALAVHAWREMRYHADARREGDTLELELHGVLWFASAPRVEPELLGHLADHKDARRLRIDLRGLGRIDLTGALLLQQLIEAAEDEGVEVELTDVPGHAHRILYRVLGWSEEEPVLNPLDDEPPP